MKIMIKFFLNKYLLLCLIFALSFNTLNSLYAYKNKKPNGVVDREFLYNINSLRRQMIKEGSEFKNVSLKFISKKNRFVVANENIQVLLIIFFN